MRLKPVELKKLMANDTGQTEHVNGEIARLKEMVEEKEEFIRVTIHELRTPLDAIRGNIDMLLKGEAGQLLPAVREYLVDVLAAADRLVKIVNDTLDLARIETGRMKFQLEDVDLTALLKSLVGELTVIAKENHITLSLEVPADLPHVFSDCDKIVEVVDNLLGNALKFTPAGGSITVSARPEGEVVLVWVKDTGIGISFEDQAKLFRRFPKIDTSLIGSPKGTGLGLVLVWQVVEKLGGEIWVESEGSGKGATFYFRLPQAGTERAQELLRYHATFLLTADSVQ